MLSVNKDGKEINIKRLGEGSMQVLVLEAIKCNYPKKYEIVDYYFKKYKFKPHRVLNCEMSFIECALKYDFDMLTKYVQDIDIKANGYNVINACVMSEKIDLLKKYIKKKGQNLNEMICDTTPLIQAVKIKNKQIFDILLDHGCKLDDMDPEYETPFSYIEKAIVEDLKNNVTEHKEFYLHAIRRLLPNTPSSIYDEMTNQKTMLTSPYLDFLIMHNLSIDKKLIEMYGSVDLLLSLTTQTNLNFFGLREHSYFVDIAENSNGIDYAKEIMSRRPYLALRKYNNGYLLKYLCSYSCPEFLDFLLKDYHLLISQIPDVIHSLTIPETLKWLKQLFEIYPSLIKCKNTENKNLIESVLLTDYTTQYKIECLEYFKSMGEFFTYCDEEGCNPLCIVIQHSDIELFTYVLSHFNSEIIKKITDTSTNEYMSCPIIQSCHYGKLDYIKLLVKHGFPIIMTTEEINNCNIEIPSCIPTILFRNNHEILQYIIECPDFKIERIQREFIFAFAKANKCSNKILSMFDESYEEKPDIIDPEVIRLNGLMSSYFSRYRASLTRDNYESNYRIISCLKTVLHVIMKIINSNTERVYKISYFNNEIESFKKYFNPKYDNVDMIHVIMQYENIDFDSRYLQSQILEPLMTGNGEVRVDCIQSHKEDLEPFAKKIESFGIMLDKLYKLLNDCEIENYNENGDENCECCKKRCLCQECGEVISTEKKLHIPTISNIIDTSGSNELYCQLVSTNPETFKGLKQINIPTSGTTNSPVSNDEIQEILRVYHTFSLELNLIDKLLSRVTYPFEAPNYYLLKQALSENIICTEQDNKYSIYQNSKPIATIYKNCKQTIPCWIENYGYNICEKMDKNHMFPFGVDIIMHNVWNSGKVRCGYATTETSKKIYIYGKVYMDDRWTRGYFEYFLNDKNILFHRLFKPLSKTHVTQHKQK